MRTLEQFQDFCRWFWRVAKPYWFSKERIKAGGILIAVIIFIVLSNWSAALLNDYQGKFTTALTDKNREDFQRYLILFGGALLALIAFSLTRSFIQSKLELYWRSWLTNNFLDRYFTNRAFYKVNSNKAIDNPDQRISEDIESFISYSLTYTLSLGSTVLRGFLFINILWSINRSLVFIAILTAIAQTFVSFFIGRILTPLNFKTIQYQADFRYGLVHIRNNSESIAFYEGENREKAMVASRFDRLLAILNAKILPGSALDAINISLSFTVFIIAYLILAPQYFAGQITIGDVTRSIPAFLTIVDVFSWFANNFQDLTLFAAVIKRLGTFDDYLKRNQHPPTGEQSIRTVIEPRFALERLTLETPDNGRVLVENLNIEVPKDRGLLIVGASGLGKSSILRAIGGLWDRGKGNIYRPDNREIIFIPQRPYMVLGSLRDQLLYPHTAREIGEDTLQEMLETVNLGDLAPRIGGFDVELNWADVLSLGEQQRLGFARLFLTSPRYAVLDESTSALDVANERLLYGLLKSAGITYISVAHRPTLVPYHEKLLELQGGGSWRILSPSEYDP